jgi:type IV pilus assembly protein PilQ
MKVIVTSIILTFFCSITGFSQKYLENQLKTTQNPNELITLSANLPFNQAVDLISKVSESTTGKKVVSTVDLNQPIGVDIQNMNYMKALMIIVQMAGLEYQEKEDVIVVKNKNQSDQKRNPDTYADVNEREVKISAVFFELDVDAAKRQGIDWKYILSRDGYNINGQLGQPDQAQNDTTTSTFRVGASGNFNVGNFFNQATAIFQFFQSRNLGTIISSPNVAVRSGEQGKIQVGQDFSVNEKDFAGNTVTKFYSTGTIIDVTPYVYTEQGINYILLNIDAERSSFVPPSGASTTSIINKTQASTQVLMLDGEETVIGGLFINDVTTVRSGIPVLKDLPWWFFGLRYIFGSDSREVTKKELVILIKANLIPTLKERVAGIKEEQNTLKDELEKRRAKMKFYEFQNQSSTSPSEDDK